MLEELQIGSEFSAQTTPRVAEDELGGGPSHRALQFGSKDVARRYRNKPRAPGHGKAPELLNQSEGFLLAHSSPLLSSLFFFLSCPLLGFRK